MVILVVVGWIVFYIQPKSVSVALNGVEYQVGNQSGHVVPVIIDVNGKVTHSLLGGKTFQGTIQLSGSTVHNPDNFKALTILFSNNHDYGPMIYGYWEKNGTPINRGYGELFTNNDFSQITIAVWTKVGARSAGKDLMLTAPAQDRPQALSISNVLMKEYLHGYVLK